MKWQYEKPVVIKIGEAVTAKYPRTEEVRQVSLHNRIGPWTLIAVIELGLLEPIAVFEDLESSTGPIIFMTQKGLLLELSKTLEPTRGVFQFWGRFSQGPYHLSILERFRRFLGAHSGCPQVNCATCPQIEMHLQHAFQRRAATEDTPGRRSWR